MAVWPNGLRLQLSPTRQVFKSGNDTADLCLVRTDLGLSFEIMHPHFTKTVERGAIPLGGKTRGLVQKVARHKRKDPIQPFLPINNGILENGDIEGIVKEH